MLFTTKQTNKFAETILAFKIQFRVFVFIHNDTVQYMVLYSIFALLLNKTHIAMY